MICKFDQNMIQDYLDERLSPEAKAQVDQHLAECETCRREWVEMNNLKQLLFGLPEEELPEGFQEELHEKLLDAAVEKSEAPKKRKWGNGHFRRHIKAYGAVAAVVLVGVVGFNAAMDQLNKGAFENVAPMMAATAPAEPVPSPQRTMGTEDTAVGMAPEAEKKAMAPNSADSSSMPAYADGGVVATAPPVTTGAGLQERKVIWNGSAQLETVNYDKTLNDLTALAKGLGGYVENMDTSLIRSETPGEKSLKQGSITLRIPQGKFMETYQGLEKYGKVTNQSMSSEDITLQYRDTYNQATNLEVREKQLRQIMTQAKTVPDILAVDSELSKVRGEINQLKGTLQQWDQLVQLSRITLSITEVRSVGTQVSGLDKNLFTRTAEGFIKSINGVVALGENLVVVMAALLPWLAIGGVLVWAFMKSNRKHNWLKRFKS